MVAKKKLPKHQTFGMTQSLNLTASFITTAPKIFLLYFCSHAPCFRQAARCGSPWASGFQKEKSQHVLSRRKGPLGMLFMNPGWLPSRGSTYPTLGKGKSSSNMPFFWGYVSSLDGTYNGFVRIPTVSG